jgi:hypothetical protein
MNCQQCDKEMQYDEGETDGDRYTCYECIGAIEYPEVTNG